MSCRYEPCLRERAGCVLQLVWPVPQLRFLCDQELEQSKPRFWIDVCPKPIQCAINTHVVKPVAESVHARFHSMKTRRKTVDSTSDDFTLRILVLDSR